MHAPSPVGEPGEALARCLSTGLRDARDVLDPVCYLAGAPAELADLATSDSIHLHECGTLADDVPMARGRVGRRPLCLLELSLGFADGICAVSSGGEPLDALLGGGPRNRGRRCRVSGLCLAPVESR